MDSENDSHFKKQLSIYIEKLVNPKPEDDFAHTIECLNTLLIASNYRQIRDVSDQMDLTVLFHQFNVANDELFSDSFASSFRMFLEALPANEVLLKYYDSVLEGLYSKDQVVVVWLKQIVKPIFTNEGLLKSVSSSTININPLLRAVIRLLPAESTLIAQIAHDILVVAAKAFRQEFFSPMTQEELCKLKQFDKTNWKIDKDTQKIRFYELVVDISCASKLLLELMKANGLLLEIVREFEENISKDPLIALNMIKLITDLASQPHGLEFLRSSTSILPSIAKRIGEIDMEDIYGALLLPGFINFFIRVADLDLKVLTEYSVVISRIMSFIEQGTQNREMLILGIDSMSYICQKSEGKLFIVEFSDKILKQIAWMIENGVTELKGRALCALNGMMEIKDTDPGGKVSQITESWYARLDESGCGLGKFMRLAQEPFPELRLPALTFIRILSSCVWGQQILANESGFLDYLLDRRTETSREGRDAKYEIVRELVMSPFIRLSFTPESILRLRGFFKTGPVDPEVNVAFENAG